MTGMFETLAPFYDLVKSHRDYESEAHDIRKVLGDLGPGRRSMLELACGTGSLLQWFGDFERVGLDASDEMLAVAREKLGERVALHRGDMASFNLDQRFEAVLLLDGAIGYIPSDELPAAFDVICEHTAQGGMVIIEPWFTPFNWVPAQTRVVSHSDSSTTIVRVSFGHEDGTIDFHNVVGTPSGIQVFDEQHRFYLHTHDQLADALTAKGLVSRELASFGSFRRGLVVATMN